MKWGLLVLLTVLINEVTVLESQVTVGTDLQQLVEPDSTTPAHTHALTQPTKWYSVYFSTAVIKHCDQGN